MSELRLNTDGHIIKFGADNDVSLTHVADTGLLLNSTMQLQFNDASQNINAPSATVLDINATDEIELNATAVDLNGTLDVSGTLTQTGVATFTARDIHSSGITIANAGEIGSVGDADSMAIASNGVVTFTQAPVFPDGSLAVADLDIDGATDIGAAVVDADLFIVDDGAGGTNRKVTASRIKTYVGGAALANDANNRVVTADGSGGINGEANLTFDGTALTANKVILTNSSGLTGGASSDGFITNADDTNTGIVFPDSDRIQFFTNDVAVLKITAEGILDSVTVNTDGHQFTGNYQSGNRTLFHFKDGAGSTCGSININAGDNTASYNTSSDYRLKQSFEDLTDGITRVKQLKPYKFNWKSNPSADKVDGFIAHEVSSVIPESISGTKDAMYPEVLYTADDELPEGKNIGDVKEETKINPQGIDQSKIVPLLTAALKEAITKIESLESRVITLEG